MNPELEAAGEPEPARSPHYAYATLAAKASEDCRGRAKKSRFNLRFKIQHIMWLSVWMAVVLAVREPLIASLPRAVGAIFVISGMVALFLFVGLYRVALLMEEGETKDESVLVMLYCLAGDLFLFVAFCLLDARM
ncbi:hypothetical protein P12x_003530 [Tundrisphaera lichenicola]|uniref:hypothetical protein n=1 Tax=Tundrisphaera lichenicola TaxID=2029860 RepID=UPI003EBC5645